MSRKNNRRRSKMACQHKRPGRSAREARIQRAREREYRKQVVILLPRGLLQRDGFLGRVVAVGIPPGVKEIA